MGQQDGKCHRLTRFIVLETLLMNHKVRYLTLGETLVSHEIVTGWLAKWRKST